MISIICQFRFVPNWGLREMLILLTNKKNGGVNNIKLNMRQLYASVPELRGFYEKKIVTDNFFGPSVSNAIALSKKFELFW